MQQLIDELLAHADSGHVPNGTAYLLKRAAAEIIRLQSKKPVDSLQAICEYQSSEDGEHKELSR